MSLAIIGEKKPGLDATTQINVHEKWQQIQINLNFEMWIGVQWFEFTSKTQKVYIFTFFKKAKENFFRKSLEI